MYISISIVYTLSGYQMDSIFAALIAEQFLEKTASQLSYHGLCELNTQVKEDQLAVLFRNNHFTTLYRHKVSVVHNEHKIFAMDKQQ